MNKVNKAIKQSVLYCPSLSPVIRPRWRRLVGYNKMCNLTSMDSNMDSKRKVVYNLAFGDGPFSKNQSVRELALVEWEGYRGWGDLYMDWVADDAAAESDSERAERLAREAAEEAEKERLKPMIELHHNQQRAMVARSRNARNKDRVGFKDTRPCRALYDFSREAGCCQTLHISTECWAHEFTDALSSEFLDKQGNLTPMAVEYAIPRALKDGLARIKRNQDGVMAVVWTPHTCWMMHPDEPGWNPIWSTNRNAEPAAPPPPPSRGPQHHQQRGQPQRQSLGGWNSEPQRGGFTGPRRDFAAVRGPNVPPTNSKPMSKGGFSALDSSDDE